MSKDKHRLFRGSDVQFLLDSSAFKEPSPAKDLRPAESDPVTLVLGGKINRPEPQTTTATKENAKSDCVEPPQANGDSDSDSCSAFFSSSLRQPYTLKEDEWILQFILKGQNIFKVSSIALWKRLESKKEKPRRTYQSLKNRFLRNIKPVIFTRYKYLIKDEETVERILIKFPELKFSTGRKETLSEIQLPERNQALSENVQVERTNGALENAHPNRVPNEPNDLSRPDSAKSNLFDVSRKVTIEDKSVTITVRFEKKKSPEIPRLGIYEKFNKLRENNELTLCTACGRYNRPISHAEDASGLSDSNILIANSLDPPEKSSQDLNSGRSGRKLRNRSYKRRKIEESQESASQASSGSRIPSGPGGNGETSRGPEAEVQAEAEEVLPSVANGIMNLDEEFDEAYHDSLSDFQKLISCEEERLLVRKCLIGNRAVIGINSCLEINTESYFLESSPKLDTPTLREGESQSLSGPLAKNMMNMLGADIELESRVRSGL